LSEQLILGIIAAIVTLIGTMLGAVVAVQNNKLTQQGREQDRQKATITRLSDEAKERQAARLAEREADRLDRESKEKEFTFWMDAHQKLSLRYTDDHAAYVALATKHDEFRRDYDTTKVQLQDVTLLSEQQKVKITHLETEQEKALSTISSMHDDHLAADRTYINEIQTLNDDATRKQGALQTQVDKLTSDLKRAEDDIHKLQRRVAEVEDTNMSLAEKNRAQDEQIIKLIAEKAALLAERSALQAELDVLKAVLYQPEPPPGNISPLPAPKPVDDLSEAA